MKERLPDLVLLDIQMPGKNGHDVLSELRSDVKTRLLPVVMLTGAASRDEKTPRGTDSAGGAQRDRPMA